MASLYLLNLDGCPAADQVGKTAQLWIRLLWDDRRAKWNEQADDTRIRAAFASMAAALNRWPAPAKFWEHLKDRPKPRGGTALMDPRAGRENEAEALSNMVRQFEELGRDRHGDLIEAEA